MTTPTHIAMGYIFSRLAIAAGVLPDTLNTYVLGIGSTNIPDLDILYFGFGPQHRKKSFLHYPIYGLSLAVLIVCLTAIVTPTNIFQAILCTIGIFSHYVMDTFSYSNGVAWLAPWNKKLFNVLSRYTEKSRSHSIRSAINHPKIYLEACIIITALFLLLFS